MSTRDDLQRTLEVEAKAASNPEKTEHKKLSSAGRKYAFKRAVAKFGLDQVTDLAATGTYFAVLSMAPAALAIFSIITLVLANNADTVESMVDDIVAQTVPADYQNLATNMVETMSASASGGVVALIIGVATALWSASAFVKAFSRNLNRMYGISEGRTLVRHTATMLGVTLTVLLAVVVILISLALTETIIMGALGPVAEPLNLTGTLDFLMMTFLPIWNWAKYLVVLVTLVLMIAVLYHFAPNVERPKFRWISTGAVFAIVGVGIAGVAMGIYLTYFASYSSYGAVGTIMAVLFVMWVFNIVLLMGAEIDIEMERARQLEAGIPAEEFVQLPPRSAQQAIKQLEKQDKLIDDGETLRRASAQP